MPKVNAREWKQLATEEGLEVLGVAKNGRSHIVVTCRNALGQVWGFTVTGTPVDYRGMLNKRAEMRRFAEGKHPIVKLSHIKLPIPQR